MLKVPLYQPFYFHLVDNLMRINSLSFIFQSYLCAKIQAMALFNHKISLIEIIREIPDSALSRIARDSHVDYYCKLLSGKLMLYLLLYGMLRVDRLSQRGLSDAFSSPSGKHSAWCVFFSFLFLPIFVSS